MSPKPRRRPGSASPSTARAAPPGRAVAVAGGDLLAGDDEKVVAGVRPQTPWDDEVLWSVQTMKSSPAARAPAATWSGVRRPSEYTVCRWLSPRYHRDRCPAPLRRVRRAEGRAVLPVGQGDARPSSPAPAGHLVGAEDHVPPTGFDRTGQVAGGGLVGRDEERRAEAARPAPEPGPAHVDAALVEDAEVAGVAHRPRGLRGLVVGVGDVDATYSRRHVDREVHPVRRAGVEVTGQRLGAGRARRGGGRELHGGQEQGRRRGGGAAQEGTTGGSGRECHGPNLSDVDDPCVACG